MEPLLGTIILFAGNFAPRGWALCNGQLLPIAQNTALFSILGTTYGGDGITTFQLPDLRCASPVGFQQGPGLANYVLGEHAGVSTVTLTPNQMPMHNHLPMGADVRGDVNSPANATWARAMVGRVRDGIYATAPDSTVMAPDALTTAGNGQPHDNLPPYLTVTFIIALVGIFPSRN